MKSLLIGIGILIVGGMFETTTIGQISLAVVSTSLLLVAGTFAVHSKVKHWRGLSS